MDRAKTGRSSKLAGVYSVLNCCVTKTIRTFPMHTQSYGAGIFVINDFLSAEECRMHIAESERIGYEEAAITTAFGPTLYKEARNNDRILYDNPALAAALYERAAPHLPEQIDGWTRCGFNERFRFYRYEGQQYFKRHKDGTFRRSDAEESMLTFIIYLNDAFTGGHTDFIWESIKPKAGDALVFPHRLTHQGSQVESGVKYVLRTDVMYREPPA